MSQSFHNRILRVNLTTRQAHIEQPGWAYFRKYLGGWNFILDILLREVPAGADPLGPDNKLIFAAGVVTGLPMTGADRLAVGAKSPLTGGVGASEAGGFFPSELKQAGWDAIIIEGASESPVYIWIRDDQVEFREAAHLWGNDTRETQHAIRDELGDQRIRCATIGLGGENQVLFANIMLGLYDAAGRTGLGAVMGSKKLKGIAVRGSTRVRPADEEAFKLLSKSFAEKGRRVEWLKMGTGSRSMPYLEATGNLPVNNFRDGAFPNAINLDGETILNEMGQGMDACYGCAVRCKKRVGAAEPYEIDPEYGGPEYETIASLGSCCGLEQAAPMVKAAELCNALSLDTISTGVSISFAMECFEAGLLSLDDTQGIDLRFGNGDAVIAMVKKIATREGLGEILAHGPQNAAAIIGHGADAFAIHVKNQAFPAHEPRLKQNLTFGYAVSPTGADHIQAMQGMALSVEDQNGMPADAMLRGTGILEPVPYNAITVANVRAAVYYSMIIGVLNSMVYCHLAELGVEMTIQDKTDLIRCATGWDMTPFELMKIGERAYTLARLFNVREGLTAADDKLPKRIFNPTQGGALANVRINPDEVADAIQLYYGMMGWDESRGVPGRAKLHELGLSWAIAHLPD